MDFMAQEERENHDTNLLFCSHGAAKFDPVGFAEIINDAKSGHEGSGVKVYMSVFRLGVLSLNIAQSIDHLK